MSHGPTVSATQDVDFLPDAANQMGMPRHESREGCTSGGCVTARATGVLEGPPVERFHLGHDKPLTPLPRCRAHGIVAVHLHESPGQPHIDVTHRWLLAGDRRGRAFRQEKGGEGHATKIHHRLNAEVRGARGWWGARLHDHDDESFRSGNGDSCQVLGLLPSSQLKLVG